MIISNINSHKQPLFLRKLSGLFELLFTLYLGIMYFIIICILMIKYKIPCIIEL